MKAATRLMEIAGELGAAQVHLGKARSMLDRTRPDAASLVEYVQQRVYALAMDLALESRKVDPWGREKHCIQCRQTIVQPRGAGRPKKFCSGRCAQDWHLLQRKLSRARTPREAKETGSGERK